MFAGDLVEQSAPPAYGNDCYPLEWPATATALAALGPSTFVPGHGDVMAPETVADQVTAIAAVAALIRELHTAGVAVDVALAEAAEPVALPSAVTDERGRPRVPRPRAAAD